MLSINTNVTALYAQLALKQHTQEINRLAKTLIDANGGGSTSADLNNASASVVPTYLTTNIRGDSQAMSNIDKSTELMKKEKDTFDKIVEALNTMRNAQDDSAKASISTYITGNSYNSRALSDGGTINFQIGYQANDKISFELKNLTDASSDTVTKLSNATFTNDQSITDALDAINRDNGSVTVMISRLGAAQSALQTDLDRSIDYRSTLLSHAVISANQELADQEMLKNAAQTILAQANASNKGIIDLIASANISYR